MEVGSVLGGPLELSADSDCALTLQHIHISKFGTEMFDLIEWTGRSVPSELSTWTFHCVIYQESASETWLESYSASLLPRVVITNSVLVFSVGLA